MVQERQNLIVLILLILFVMSLVTSLLHTKQQFKRQISDQSRQGFRRYRRSFQHRRNSAHPQHWFGEWLAQLLGDFAPEFAGALILAVATILLINPAEQTQTQEELVNLVGSQYNAIALNAIEELRARGWLSQALAGANLTNADLRFAILDDIDMEGATLVNANLQNASFVGSNLSDAQFNNSNLVGADFSDAILQNTAFVHTNLQNANLKNAQLVGTNFSSVTLDGVNFAGANLQMVRLPSANLQTVIFGNSGLATLAETATLQIIYQDSPEELLNSFQDEIYRDDFIDARLARGGSSPLDLLTETPVVYVQVRRSTECPTSRGSAFRSSSLISMFRSDLQFANMQGMNLRWFELREVNLINANLRDVQLTSSSLQHSLLVNTELENAALDNVDFSNAILIDANLRNSVLCFSNFENADLALADLRGANLYGSILRGAIIGDEEPNFIGDRLANETTIFDPNTILPDGERWNPTSSIERFTNPQHPDFWNPCHQLQDASDWLSSDWCN